MSLFRQFCFIIVLVCSGVVNAEVILTITGEIDAPNRGGRDDFRDGVFKNLNVDFEQAREITREEIKALPQQMIDVHYENWPSRDGNKPHVCKGPALEDVLALAQPTGQVFVTQALDGYAWPYERKMVDFNKVVVAHTLNDRELSIGGRGPLMLCMQAGSYQAEGNPESALIWALFHIQVREKS